MSIFGWIIFGLLAGAVARALTPGKHQLGCFGTMAVGGIGALIGGLVGEVVLDRDVHFGWDLGPFLLAVAGAVAFLLLLNALRRR